MNMKHLLAFGLISVLLLLMSCSKTTAVQLHTIGDSTMEQQDPNIKDQRGWPQFLSQFFSDEVRIVNHGKSGSSTKTFYHHGFWARAKNKINPGDYVIIQFAHNDEKHDGIDGAVGTAPTDSFRIYLSRYVDEVRQLGANPILMSPVVRKMFNANNTLSRRGKHDLGEHVHMRVDSTFDANDTIAFNYTYNMKHVADSLQCPFVDMCSMSAQLIESLGPEKSTELIYNLPKDGTHFGALGALLFSELAAKALKRQHILDRFITLPAGVVVSPEAIDLGDRYVGTSFTRAFTVGYLHPASDNGIITVDAPEGYLLSTEENGEYTRQVALHYVTPHDINAGVFKLYLKIEAATIGEMLGTITASDGKTTKRIPFCGQCISLDGEKEVTVAYALSSHPKPVASGAVVALEEVWSGMELETFIRPRELGLSDPDGSYYNTKVQCNTIEGGQWPVGEIDVVHSRYIQFGMQAIEGSKVTINQIKLNVGGGARYRILCSKQSDFSDAITLGERVEPGNEMIAYTFDAMQEISNGECFYLRIYPWSGQKNTPCYLCLHRVQFSGMQTLVAP